jgi:hypothetical protein
MAEETKKEEEKEEKLSELFPGIEKIEMLLGKKAVLGPFTLEHGIWAEEKYGDMESFIKIFTGSPKIKEVAELLYALLLNPEEFKDITDFTRHFPISKMDELRIILGKIIANSMANNEEVGEESKGEEEKK